MTPRPPGSDEALDAFDAIYAAVMSIPRGRVATYGQVAEAAGLPRRARLVGYALKHLSPGSGVPWHRVVNAGGRISPRGSGDERDQRRMLESEGVVFRSSGTIDLERYRCDLEG
jgi:methylated-DNA-protein-cysteine methyltransferase-like protein